MTKEYAQKKALVNQHLIGNKYSTEEGDILVVSSVSAFDPGYGNWQAYAFFEPIYDIAGRIDVDVLGTRAFKLVS